MTTTTTASGRRRRVVDHADAARHRLATRPARPRAQAARRSSRPITPIVVACHTRRRAELPPFEPERAEHRQVLAAHPHGRHQRVDDGQRGEEGEEARQGPRAAPRTSRRLFTSEGSRGSNTSVPVASASSALATAGSTPSAQSISTSALISSGAEIRSKSSRPSSTPRPGSAPLVDHREDGRADHGGAQRAGQRPRPRPRRPCSAPALSRVVVPSATSRRPWLMALEQRERHVALERLEGVGVDLLATDDATSRPPPRPTAASTSGVLEELHRLPPASTSPLKPETERVERRAVAGRRVRRAASTLATNTTTATRPVDAEHHAEQRGSHGRRRCRRGARAPCPPRSWPAVRGSSDRSAPASRRAGPLARWRVACPARRTADDGRSRRQEPARRRRWRRSRATTTAPSTSTPGSGSARPATPTGISGDARTLDDDRDERPEDGDGDGRGDRGRPPAPTRSCPSAASHRSLDSWRRSGAPAPGATATTPASAATSAHRASAATMTSMLDSIFRSTSVAGVISSGASAEHLPQGRGDRLDVGGAAVEAHG